MKTTQEQSPLTAQHQKTKSVSSMEQHHFSDAERVAALESATRIFELAMGKEAGAFPQFTLKYAEIVGMLAQIILLASRDRQTVQDYKTAIANVKVPNKMRVLFDTLIGTLKEAKPRS